MRSSPCVSDLEREGTSWDPAEGHHYLNHGVRFGIAVGHPVSRQVVAVELMSKAGEAGKIY